MTGTNDNDGMLDRALDLLAKVWEEPLVVLPGHDPGDIEGTTELRLSHFRPELSESIAGILDEAGR